MSNKEKSGAYCLLYITVNKVFSFEKNSMDNTSDLKIDDENNEWDLNRGIGMSMF